ncbi:MarR family winged helix-turn-helix transcriptional regulator [Solihabitans fulvus]|uniref:MarR family winged helix-turn-helix transcriptional regulator n=1 Tax=Solihabitans fulvus TaxID=1892852 RepID=UPI001CB76288|nr:MarR family transcriptional regulator [Solihabitans fulvus]
MAAADARLVDVLTSAQRILSRDLAERLGEEAVSVEQWRVLRTLANAAGTSMSELAEQVQIPAPSLTRLVDLLVDRAQVYRRQSARDGRRIDVHLSESGRELLPRLEAIAEAHERNVVRLLGGEAVAAMLDSLEQIAPPALPRDSPVHN